MIGATIQRLPSGSPATSAQRQQEQRPIEAHVDDRSSAARRHRYPGPGRQPHPADPQKRPKRSDRRGVAAGERATPASQAQRLVDQAPQHRLGEDLGTGPPGTDGGDAAHLVGRQREGQESTHEKQKLDQVEQIGDPGGAKTLHRPGVAHQPEALGVGERGPCLGVELRLFRLHKPHGDRPRFAAAVTSASMWAHSVMPTPARSCPTPDRQPVPGPTQGYREWLGRIGPRA